MNGVVKHIWRSMVAGVVALLPIGGTVLLVVYLESELRVAWRSFEWLRPFYFPGLGLLAAAVLIYVVGLLVSTFLGKFLIGMVDKVLDRLPLLGGLYQTFKQILGYGGGKDALFQHVVLVRSREHDAVEIGLVTNSVRSDSEERSVVFVPSAATPTSGRLLLVEPELITRIDMPVHDALSALVSVGKVDIPFKSASRSDP